ncbi:uncharacterized protein BJ212DRAFT_32956 [Suillus subaureus]|uniref:Uncharacterized protein n=1 Tax=Suillus subaureus TaxID=48587 RepID=A0A9P7ENP3_9AGAM|nr:uncharacterized protein BJ212DRAFT_32956 [Suillus subaureus]KAG1827130.1 hypothetical protein BJ212DRAFT_32956 [Suillus subaureus]
MCTELVFISQPARQCKDVQDVKMASKMDSRQWQRLRALVIDSAARFLNIQDRYEHQDPEMVRLFYQAVHATWPEVAEKYPNSWVLVWYLRIYLLKRVYRKHWYERKIARERAGSQVRQQPRRLRTKNTNRLSVRQLNTAASQACVATRTRKRATARDRHAFPSGPEITASPTMHCSPVIAPQRSGSLSSPASAHSHGVLPVQSSHAVFQFLNSMTPSLVKLVPDFLSAGIYDQNHLEDFFTWPEKAQRNFLLKTFIGRMNALELGTMLIALNSRRRS